MTLRDVTLAFMQILFQYSGWLEYNLKPLTEALVELPDPSRFGAPVEWAEP